jgi:hypothetical protein
LRLLGCVPRSGAEQRNEPRAWRACRRRASSQEARRQLGSKTTQKKLKTTLSASTPNVSLAPSKTYERLLRIDPSAFLSPSSPNLGPEWLTGCKPGKTRASGTPQMQWRQQKSAAQKRAGSAHHERLASEQPLEPLAKLCGVDRVAFAHQREAAAAVASMDDAHIADAFDRDQGTSIGGARVEGGAARHNVVDTASGPSRRSRDKKEKD